jgi:hypothetical protein
MSTMNITMDESGSEKDASGMRDEISERALISVAVAVGPRTRERWGHMIRICTPRTSV